MKTSSRLLLATLSLCASAACADGFSLNLNKLFDLGKSTATLAGGIGQKEEIQLGDDIAAGLLGAAPLVEDAELQRYVNQVGMWLVAQTERADLPWRFAVLDSPSINAFAVPGGQVYLTRGLFALLQNEAELAGVLSHEIAHIVKKQHVAQLQKQAGVNIVGDIASMAAEQRSNNQAAQRASKLLSAAMDLYITGLSKTDEYEADRMAVVIAARAGYDPFGLPSVLQAMQAITPGSHAVAVLFKSHPLPEDRLSALDRAIGEKFDAERGVEQTARFEHFHQRLIAR